MQPPGQTLKISEQSPLAEALKKAFGLFAILLVLSIGLYALGSIFGTKMADAGHSASTERHEIVISNDVLSVPENMIRFSEQRIAGIASRLDLYAHWPTRAGYSRETAALFNETDPGKAELVFISLRPRDRVLEMRDRLGPVYQKALEAEERIVHDGLTIRRLKPELGYTDEILAYAARPGMASGEFVARCQTASQQPLLAACETELFVGRSLEAQVRFPAHMLDQWRTMAADLNRFLQSMMISPQG